MPPLGVADLTKDTEDESHPTVKVKPTPPRLLRRLGRRRPVRLRRRGTTRRPAARAGQQSDPQHAADGRTLEGFQASGTSVTYVGEFDLVDYYFTEAHETGSDVLRQVVVFRLRPRAEVTVELPHVPVTRSREPRVEVVPVEEQHTERSFVTPDREPYELERREAALVHKYREHLRWHGHQVSRLRVVAPGESYPLYSDLWDETALELIEAKGTATREQLRVAVGQLLDYGRFVDAKRRSVLLPSRPRGDLLEYLHAVGLEAIYPDGDEWVRE